MHIIYSRSPPPQTLLSSRTELPFPEHRAINKQKNTASPPTQTRNRQLRINTSLRPPFYLQSEPYKERSPSCMPAIHTLAHRDVIIVLPCVCLCLISIIYIFPLFFFSPVCVCVCVCVRVSVFQHRVCLGFVYTGIPVVKH